MTTLLAASLLALGAATVFSGVERGAKPPQRYDDKVVLRGAAPSSAKSMSGFWQYGYMLEDAPLESGKTDVIIGTMLTLKADGSYELHYHARWNLPAARPQMKGPFSIPIPLPGPSNGADGIDVSETGRFVLSGQMLLVEPAATRASNLEHNKVVNERKIENETHVLVTRLDGKELIVAGRCASYQIDPVCKSTPTVWYPMKAQVGKSWFGTTPR